MTFLLTVLRGLRSRALLSAGSALLVALAIGSAVLGPLFSEAVTDSFLVSRLDQAPNAETGLSWNLPDPPSADPTSSGPAPAEAITAAAAAARSAVPAGDQRYFAAPQTFLVSQRVKSFSGSVELGSKPDQCDHLEVTGRCPSTAGEVMLLTSDLARAGFTLGQQVELPRLGTVTVVGSYRSPAEADADYWFDPSRLSGSVRIGTEKATYNPAPWLTVPATFDTLAGGSWSVLVDRRLAVPPDLTTGDVADVVAATAVARRADTDGLTWQSRNAIALDAREIRQQQSTARASIAPAVFSLVLVALALLLRLLTAAADLRLPELALASLRGLPRRRMWQLGLSEPLAVLAVATPVGAVLGVLGALMLVRAWLVPGLPLRLPIAAVATGLLVVVGTLVVAALAVGQVLRVSLAEQLTGVRRPQRSGRWAVVGQLALVAVTLAVLVSKLTGGSRGEPDVTDLVLPVLLAVVAGLAASRLVAGIATAWTRRRTGRSLPGFVAARALSRRQEGILVILPITAAIAVAVFGAGVYDSAAQWRTSVAATVAPAADVYLASTTMSETVATTHRIDPQGRYLMATTTFSSQGPSLVIADTPRLARVATWPDQWTPGTSTSQIADRLSLHATVPVVRGSTLGVRLVTGSAPGTAGGQALTLQVVLGSPDGASRSVFLGPYSADSVDATADVGFCAQGEGCRLEGLVIGGGAATPVPLSGRLTIGDITVDGRPLAGAITGAGWVRTPGASAASAVSSVRTGDGRIEVDVDSGDSPVVVQLASGALPAALPVVAGLDARTTDQLGAASASGFTVRPVLTARSVPLLGPLGVLVDYTTLTTDRSLLDQQTPVYVLARADTPRAVVDALRDSGATLSTTLAEQQRTLGQSAYALALRLYAVVAALVLLMALAGLSVSTAVQLPARRRDAAALRVVGVPRRAVLSATVRELAAVLGSTAVAGLAAGTLAQYVVLRTVQLGYLTSLSTPPLVADIDPTRLVLLAVLAAVALGAVALVSAALVVRGARGSTLRETAR